MKSQEACIGVRYGTSSARISGPHTASSTSQVELGGRSLLGEQL